MIEAKDQTKLPFEAVELARVAIINEQEVSEKRMEAVLGPPPFKHLVDDEATKRARLSGLVVEALRQHMGLPVSEPLMDYNRLLKYCSRTDRFTEYENTGKLPDCFRAKDLKNPPYWFCNYFEVHLYIKPIEKSLEDEIKRIKSIPGQQEWLLNPAILPSRWNLFRAKESSKKSVRKPRLGLAGIILSAKGSAMMASQRVNTLSPRQY